MVTPDAQSGQLDGKPSLDGHTDRQAAESSTVAKSLDLLNVVSLEPNGIGLNDLCRKLGANKSPVSRILAALKNRGAIVQDPETKKYRLGYALLELASRVLEGPGFHDLIRYDLPVLARTTGETAHLGVLDGYDVLFVGQAQSTDPIRMYARLGLRVPSHCTSMGKVLLAALPEPVRETYYRTYEFRAFTPHTILTPEGLREELAHVSFQGYAVDNEEHRLGVRCVGAPIRDALGNVVGAVSISGPAFRMTDERIPELSKAVRDTATSMSHQLGSKGNRILPGPPALRHLD